MSQSLPTPEDDTPPDEILAARLRNLFAATHAQWSVLAERRRMRAFGFRPAVEPGVLKREWESAEVRVSATHLRIHDGESLRLTFSAADQTLETNDAPFVATGPALALAETLMRLIHEYERWVEAREGRRQRIERAPSGKRRPFNALAEVRQLQRALQASRRR